jgi:prepilin-type N-terminal cleavage/methylation domain-containing protein
MKKLRRRLGFSLAEILVAMTILGIIGAGMTRVLVNQNRFFDKQNNVRAARSIARNAMNVLMSDLRMVQDSGSVDSVSADGRAIRVLVPYAFGLVCQTSGNVTTVSMLPVDSAVSAMAVYKGFAFRNTTSGRYTFITPLAPTSTDQPISSPFPSRCTGSAAGEAQINTVGLNTRTGSILDLNSPAPSGATQATPMFLYQRVTYSFRTSTAYPSYYGLWRDVDGGSSEELMAPFASTARFQFYTSGAENSVTTVPALGDIRGVDILLYSVSPRATSNNTNPSTSKMVTSVFFKNVRSF